MNGTTWQVAIGDDTTTAEYESSLTGDDQALFVCGHGAGGSMSDRSTLAAAKALRQRGFGVVRFNFLYKEKGSGRPDPADADVRGGRRTCTGRARPADDDHRRKIDGWPRRVDARG